MADFEALIKAKLDTTGIPGQIKSEIESKEITLTPNASKLVSDIRDALKNNSFDININPVINPNSGKSAGKKIAQAAKTAIKTGIGNDAVNINLSDVLELKGIDKKLSGNILDSFRKDINKTIVDLKQIDAQFTETKKGAQKLKSVKFVGIDDEGKTVSILSKIDQKSGEVSSTLTRVSQKFGEVTKSSGKANKKFSELLSTAKEIGRQELEITGLDPVENEKQLAASKKRLKSLQDHRDKLLKSLNGNMTSDQNDQYSRILTDNAEKVEKLKGKLQDLAKLDVEDIKLEFNSNSIDAEIQNVTKKLETLKSTGHVKLVDVQDEVNDLNTFRNAIKDAIDSGDGNALKIAFDSFNTTLEKAKNNLSIISDESKTVVTSLKASTLDNKMGTWLEKNSKAAKDYGGSIRELQEKLRSLNRDGKLTQEQFDKIEREFKEIQQAAITAGKTGKSFGDSLKKAFQGVVGLVSVATVVDKAVEALREMYQAVYEIDTAMVNLKKVTDETEASYSKFLDRSADSAQELGRTVSSLVEQTAKWSKLGYSLNEAEELAKLSSVYANVAEVDDDTAVSDMVTALKAFKMETSEAERVVDSLNELGNRFATDAASLGQGLSKSASAMSVAGADMYETLAMITGVAEITQDAGGAGNALKIASMRIRGMKGELEDLGEEVDETVDSISKVQTQILNLTHGKVNIFDNAGEFRDYYKIMEEIAAIYNDLTSTEQASLSEILFGKNRGNQGAALIQAFQSGQVQKAYETAMNSAGSASEEQARWMEGLEAEYFASILRNKY